ncbi:MAG: hypothetical protein ABEN55_01615, partial [Bradymonadaceae bacterium]
TFDSYLSSPDSVTWYRDWASRSMRLDPKDSGLNDVYHAAMRALVEADVFRSFDVGVTTVTTQLTGLCRRRYG